MFDIKFFLNLFPVMMEYIVVTFKMSLISLCLALLLGTIIAFIVHAKIKFLDKFIALWISLFRGTPLVAQLFFLSFGLPQIVPILKKASGLTIAIIGLSLNASAYMAEALRGAILSVDKGQMEACLSIGMTNFQAMVRVVLPQAIRVAIPALSNNFIDIIKGSAMAFAIGVTELMGAAQMEGASNYKFLETFTAVMLVYWCIISAFGYLQKIFENRMSRGYMV